MKLKFGIIGQGYIGKRHSDVIKKNVNCELIAVCDIMPLSKLNLDLLGEHFYSSAEEMLNSHPEIDIVCICTPNGLHAEHAMLCLSHNKHVIIEKPMALNKADCEKIVHKSLQLDKKVFCVMQNRYSPPSIWLKHIIDSGKIGEVYLVQLNCYWNRDSRYYKKGGWKGTSLLDGGTLFTQFSHWIDIMYWIFGDIHNIHAKFKDFNHNDLTEFEDSGFISFDFKNEGVGILNYSTSVWNKNLESSITIIGSRGSIKIGGQYMDKVEICDIENYEMPSLPPTNPANNYGVYVGSANNHSNVIQNVVQTLYGSDQITTNALDGLKVVEIIEKIYSFKGNSKNL